jgi:hypothetical protein
MNFRESISLQHIILLTLTRGTSTGIDSSLVSWTTEEHRIHTADIWLLTLGC